MAKDPNNLVWIDLEMTGLDSDRDCIIEIATIVTTSTLEIVAEGPEIAVKQPDEALAAMDEWNTRQHGQSGLVDRVRASEITEREAERLTVEFLREYIPRGASPMCGNSVCQDRRFLYRRMPELESWFHYRNLDVSTLKELCIRWSPHKANGFSKNTTHRALQDVRDSIAELSFYRERFIDTS